MKIIIYLILNLCFLLIFSVNSYAEKQTAENAVLQKGNIPPVNYCLDHAAMGTEFWVAFPPNAPHEGHLSLNGLDIIVTSVKNTTVRVEAEDQFLITRQVEAFKPALFSTSKNDFGSIMEVKESDETTYKAIHITSEEPVSVFVFNNRSRSSDGYSALPVSSWGSEYTHCSYYDFNGSFGWYTLENGGGFIVMASEEGTRVNITLKGKGEGMAKTLGQQGRDIGDSYQVQLSPGQTYMICGDGKTKGLFDLTGTSISANKPIGVVSFHMSTMLPSQCPMDNDFLMEMLTPVNTWGTRFVTVQYDRSPSGSNKGEGDFFRVVSKEAATNVSCKYYDIQSGELIGNWPTYLKKEGSFSEYNQATIASWTGHDAKSIRGLAVWESDKPIMLMQYAYSYPWDNNYNWSPLMVNVSPISNFVNSAVFQTPLEDFSDNTLTLMIIGDPNDPKHKKINSVYLDGEQLTHKHSVIGNQIPGTDIYWVRIDLEAGAHSLYSSETRFWGYMNGFSMMNAYGWPIAMGAKITDKEDSSPPQFIKKEDCGNFDIEVTEKNIAGNFDQGISKIFMYDSSYNYDFQLINPEDFKPELKSASQKFTLRVNDPLKPAKAWFVAMDRAGNLNFDSVFYEPEHLRFNIKSADLGRTRVGTSKDSSFRIINDGAESVSVESAELKYGAVFSLKDIELPHTLEPGDTLEIKYTYMPLEESKKETEFDTDTVFISSVCIDYHVVLKGKGTMPHIAFQNIEFGTVETGNQICYEDIYETGFLIENPGSAVLNVKDIKGIKPPFLLSSTTEPEFPFEVKPGEKVPFYSICFLPSEEGTFEQEITIVSDAPDDSTLFIRGTGDAEIESVTEILSGENYISVIPHPIFGDEAEIIIKGDISFSNIELFDIQGRKVRAIASETGGQIINTININVSGLSAGVYYLKFISKDKIYIKRIIVAA